MQGDVGSLVDSARRQRVALHNTPLRLRLRVRPGALHRTGRFAGQKLRFCGSGYAQLSYGRFTCCEAANIVTAGA
ncbi:hypothetical protein [Halomonas sp. A29]|uniref:hypothetical protein n=1 Tax=Halomonas sp. A29 TaxID=3102786 RepID=UPI00398A9F78